jgi:tyrosinase
LLLTIHLKCRAGLGKLTDKQKQNNQYSFLPCPHREDSGFFTAMSMFTMRAGENGVSPKQVNQNGQVMYPFFKDIPSQYYKLADITTLGVNKYNYRVSGLVGQLAVNCERTSNSRRLHEGHGDDKTAKRSKCLSELDDSGKSESAAAQGGHSSPEQAFLVDTSLDSDVDAGKVMSWIEEVKKLYAELPEDKSKDPEKDGAVFELERMVCMFYDQCRGGITDYSDEFKVAFNVTEPPPCKPIVDTINSECKRLRLSNWKETMEKYFPCNLPQGAESASIASDLPDSSSSSSSSLTPDAY